MLSSFNIAQPDVTLRLDLSGVIRRAALSNAISGEGIDEWVGRPWADTVAEGGGALVRQMIEAATSTGVSSFHQVRQRFPSGLELAVEYTTVQLGGNAGLIAVGRNLEVVTELRSRLVAAQKSMERDYWKLREIETRYRLLFDASAQPVLLISADDTRILEANPAAIRALGVSNDHELLPEIHAVQRDVFRAMLARVREQGKAPGIVIHLGPDRHPWLVRASLIAAEPAPVFVLQMSPSGAVHTTVDKSSGVNMEELIARLPEGFVVLDTEGKVLRVNRAFMALIEQPVEGAVLGQRLDRWLPRPEVEAGVLLDNVQQNGVLSRLATKLRSEGGTEIDVEISAVGNSDTKSRYLGVLLRRIPHASETVERGADSSSADPPPVLPKTDLRQAVLRQADLPQADQVGKSTLREIVQETVAAVERSCIEVALELAQGNRTAAAEMLGVSRQSLYSKLGRYSLDAEVPPGLQQKDRAPGGD